MNYDELKKKILHKIKVWCIENRIYSICANM